MLFILTRELWQTVRHCTRKPTTRSEIWFWTEEDSGDEVFLCSRVEKKTLSDLIGEAVKTTMGPVSIVVASTELSDRFEQIVEFLAGHPGDLRISLMITSCLDERQVGQCREFLRDRQNLQTRVSTFFLATNADSEFSRLKPAAVSEEYLSFLRLLCGGREGFAQALDIFRPPLAGYFDDEDEDDDEAPPSRYRATGILAALGVRAWLPQKEKIIELTEEMLSLLVAEEKHRAAAEGRARPIETGAVIGAALRLSPTDEPLAPHHFSPQIPEPQESPFESWRVPLSTTRARKERHDLHRVVQRDFAEYTASLEAALRQIGEQIEAQQGLSFSEAARTYRSDIMAGIDLGGLALLVRDYFPDFAEEAQAEEEPEEPDWLPDRSQDCFCDVYEALEDGLNRLPTIKIWAGAAVAAPVLAGLALFGGADWRVALGLAVAGLLGPAALWVYRRTSIRDLRRQLVDLSEDIFFGLRKSFEDEVQWILERTRRQLEQQIRADATAYGERLRSDFDSISWLSAESSIEPEKIPAEIRRVRAALVAAGIDEGRIDRLPDRLADLVELILERAGKDPASPDESWSEMSPEKLVNEWIDELVDSALLPLERIKKVKPEILAVAGDWRAPPFMAPLTDAELHRGFRKVVALPDSNVAYHHLREDLPKYSGNPVVRLNVWPGSVPGIAICSVITGLPDTILDYQARTQSHVQPL